MYSNYFTVQLMPYHKITSLITRIISGVVVTCLASFLKVDLHIQVLPFLILVQSAVVSFITNVCLGTVALCTASP